MKMSDTKNTAAAVSAEAMNEHRRLMEAFDIVLEHLRVRRLALEDETKVLAEEARKLKAFAEETDSSARDQVQARAH
jgi:hypothetical protein